MKRRRLRGHSVRPRSQGFIVINTRTGAILSDLHKKRDGARAALAEYVTMHGSHVQEPGYVEYRGGKWYQPLGIHQVMLYPGETYARESYKP